MAVTYLKKAARTAVSEDAGTREAVAHLLAEIETGGEPVAARSVRLEGMEGHALTGEVRLAQYVPGERFELAPEVPAP